MLRAAGRVSESITRIWIGVGGRPCPAIEKIARGSFAGNEMQNGGGDGDCLAGAGGHGCGSSTAMPLRGMRRARHAKDVGHDCPTPILPHPKIVQGSTAGK